MKTPKEHLEIQEEEAKNQGLTVTIKGYMWVERAMESYVKQEAENQEKKFRSFIRTFHLSRKWDEWSNEYDKFINTEDHETEE